MSAAVALLTACASWLIGPPSRGVVGVAAACTLRSSNTRMDAPPLSPSLESVADGGPEDLLERLSTCPAEGLDEKELEALKAASLCLEPCGADLKTPFGSPLTFFGALRSPSEDPTPAMWDAVRTKWPILASKSDEEMQPALVHIAAVQVDRRSLPKPPF
mmetsp:Transcript_47780/g.150103  ORF Transcript_47780/g.150103 Transcript_47780/m.150103 type:complete len:160 (-) Transcript_47780:193-672(-)